MIIDKTFTVLSALVLGSLMAYRKDIRCSQSGFDVGKTTEKANLKFQSFLATCAAEMT